MLGSPGNPFSYATWLVLTSLHLFILMRFGLVAAVLALFSHRLLLDLPTILDSSAWYFGYGFTAFAVFAAIVLYAFRTSLGGRPVLAPSRLDDSFNPVILGGSQNIFTIRKSTGWDRDSLSQKTAN